ncbi:hypothetical protein CDAR_512231 [Caerostris darwini]|uniref:Uncharacterized protein n=1 Tax=Caerostris darwini TaxID=1538125 RepID=A0AAV4WK57_9ARAC|nr:hypothetical protein CDAR_512231 [Caerostris darwini]
MYVPLVRHILLPEFNTTTMMTSGNLEFIDTWESAVHRLYLGIWSLSMASENLQFTDDTLESGVYRWHLRICSSPMIPWNLSMSIL